MRASTLLGLALAVAGCASTPKAKPRPSTPMPSWVADMPAVRGKVYAVGRSGPTFWQQDALSQAQEDARGKLAIALQSNMEVLTKRVETSSGTAHLDLVKAASDMVLSNSRIEATWVDAAGVTDLAGTTYALAYVELDSAQRGREREVETTRQAGVPAWLDRLPSSQGRMYAHGYSGPTRRPDDAVEYAGDDAMENLAKALRSHVQAYQLLVENNTGLSIDEFSRTERPDEQFLDLIKKKAKVESTWVDGKGIKPGYPPGAVWALAYVEVGSTKSGYQQVANEATGPALDRRGEAGPEPEKKKEAPAPAAPQPAPQAAPAPAPAAPASAPKPAAKGAPYPAEGEKCKPGYEPTGGWCLPAGAE